MQPIDPDIAEQYDLDIKSIAPFKDAYIINTSAGRKILKKSILLPERVLFVHYAKEHLYKNNFTNIDRFLCTQDGLPYYAYENGIFTITEMIEGNECNFDNKRDMINASRHLALLHKASKGFIPPYEGFPRDDLGKLPIFLNKRLEEIKRLKKTAKKGRSKFDYLFLDYADFFYKLGENAIRVISLSNYEGLVSKARGVGILCHHDYTHHNIICSSEGIFVINFDFCSIELKVYDLANLIRRKMRKCNWNAGEAKSIISEYRQVEEIAGDELLILKAMLQFPQKFWRVINKYYNSRRSWSEKTYISKLYEVIEEAEAHGKFMERFDELI